jgi:cell division ATPase FtsA
MPRSRLAEIIHLRVAEILTLLGKEIQRQFAHPLHSGAVLVGGTALVTAWQSWPAKPLTCTLASDIPSGSAALSM